MQSNSGSLVEQYLSMEFVAIVLPVG